MKPLARLCLLALGLMLLAGCAESESVALRSWTFVPERAAPRALELPAHVDRELTPSPQTYHLRTSVELLPSMRGRSIALVIPHLWAKVALRADGRASAPRELDSTGAYRAARPHLFWIPGEQTLTPRLELDLEVRHEWAQSGWLDTVPYLTAEPGGGIRYAITHAVDEYGNLLGAGSVFTISFAYAVAYLLDRRRTAHGWFALQGGTALPQFFFNAGTTQAWFGRYDALPALVTVACTIFASIHFTRTQFQLAPAGRIWAVLLAIVVAGAIAQPGPFDLTYTLAPLMVVMVTAGVVNQLIVVGRLALRRDAPQNARVALTAWMVVVAFSTSDLGAWLGLGERLGGVRTAGIGVGLYGLLQSVALSRNFMSSLRESLVLNERLNLQVTRLAEQDTIVRGLNDELRRQVLARSEQLSDALSRLASAQGQSVVLREGDVIEDRYEIVRAIGAGGMGVVYEVRRTNDGARLAMKVLSGVATIRELARFAREAKLAAAVNHENVVKIHDTLVSKEGFLLLVLEYVDGEPLNRRRARYGDVPWALGVLAGVARGLAAIHEQAIVHRDLKPGNVLVRDDAAGAPCIVKITDFGISSAAISTSTSESVTADERRDVAAPGEGDAGGAHDEPETARWSLGPGGVVLRDEAATNCTDALTQAGVLLGTPVYMAPEVIRDPRSPMPTADIYGLGVLAFELLHRRRPFTEGEAIARSAGHFDAKLPSATSCGVPPPIATLLDAALDVDPQKRPTAAALADALASDPHGAS